MDGMKAKRGVLNYFYAYITTSMTTSNTTPTIVWTLSCHFSSSNASVKISIESPGTSCACYVIDFSFQKDSSPNRRYTLSCFAVALIQLLTKESRGPSKMKIVFPKSETQN